jgi:DNA-binding NarL/FixJ family response regulator
MPVPTAASHLVVRGSRTALDRLVADRGGSRCWCGAIETEADAQSALLAAARGGQVVALAATDATVMDAFIDDLRLTGRVEIVDAAVPDRCTAITPQQAALLDLVGRGVSVAAAARALHVSRRTAARRLADARDALGVATTTEAVVTWRQR